MPLCQLREPPKSSFVNGFVDRLGYFALVALWRLFGAFSLATSRRLLEGLGTFVAIFDKHHAQIIADNLELAFPELDDAARQQLAVRSVTNWGRMAAELAHADELYTPEVAAAYEPIRRKTAELHERGKGVLLLTAHCGNFELMGRHWGRGGGRIALFHRPFSNPLANEWLLAQRLSTNLRTIGRGSQIRQTLRFLRDGIAVAAPLDQNQLPGRGVFVEHFGKLASTSTMLARLSDSLGAPVLPVYAYWDGELSWPRMGEVIEPSGPGSPVAAGQDRDARLLALTQAYSDSIEEMVCSYPSQWNWSHRRWKTRPPVAS
ncbi:MAG: KDO2-lipid IV(A) lauroyltransferase [Hyphomicrobiaceae bacterium]|jgi:KDO2-lipid IV(A) lauroyltransferase